MTASREKRKSTRVPVHIPVGIYLKEKPYEALDAEILDISEGGAFVHCTAPVPIGKEIMLEIRFAETKFLEGKIVEHNEEIGSAIPDGTPEKSVIRWARGTSRSGFGVEFVGLKADKKRFLSRLVKYFETLKKAGVTGEEF